MIGYNKKDSRQPIFNKYIIRKIFSRKTMVENFTIDVNSKNHFFQITFLFHFSNEKTFYIDIDASKRRGSGTMVYRLKITCSNFEKTKRIDIEFILFLNRIFNETKIKYYYIEFELVNLI